MGQNREVIRIVGWREWAIITLRLREVRDWFEQIIYCHHNARVLAETEWRLSSVLCEATGGKMSKPGYDEQTMLIHIRDYMQEQYEQGYNDAKEELASS